MAKKFELTDEKKKELQSKLEQAKVALLLKCPFYGMLAARLDNVFDDRVKTAATDGEQIIWSYRFLDTLKSSEVEFVYCHEILHVALDHLIRKGSRNHDVWNFAIDYFVNYDLSNETLDVRGKSIKGIGKRPKICLYDPKYAGMTSEEIYAKIIKDFPQMSGPGAGSEGEDQDGNPTPGQGNPGEKEGQTVLDDHGFWKNGKTDSEMKAAADSMKRAILDAAKQCGKAPGAMKDIVKLLQDSYVDWRQFINSFIESAMKDDRTWMRPSRRSESVGCYLPSYRGVEKVRIGIALDVSGSMSDKMIQELLAEARGTMEQFVDYELHVWTFDTKVYPESHQTFSSFDSPFTEYKIVGRGGTDFAGNFKYVIDRGLELDRLLVFTDGFAGFEKCVETVPTLWLIHCDGQDAKNFKPPFGTVVEYRKEKKDAKNGR